jgi:hypothetical protein
MDNPNTLTHKDSVESEAEREKRARANAAQFQERITLVAELMIKGLNKSEIKDQCKKRFGVTGRRVDDYMSRARRMMVEQTKSTIEHDRAEAILRYKSIISNDKLPMRDRLKACKHLNEIQGLFAPRSVVNVNTQNNLTVNQGQDSGNVGLFDGPASEQLGLIIEGATAEELEVVGRIMERIEQQRAAAS